MSALARLIELDAAARLRARDVTLFGDDPADRDLAGHNLGWTDLAERAGSVLPTLGALALEAAEEDVTDVVLLGMGGSSLASLVLREVLAETPAALTLHVLDTTSPITISRTLDALDLARTLVLVASKSGGTVEPLSLYAVFRERADALLGRAAAGRRFIAITDPGTPLESLAAAEGMRACLSAPSDVGGRFSALSLFGLTPACLAGIDCDVLTERAREMEAACALPAGQNPGVALAAFLADAHAAGRDKLMLVTSAPLASFGLWAEQLVAESLGKEGTGILPVIELAETPQPNTWCADRAVVVVRLAADDALAAQVPALSSSAPVIELVLRDGYDIGAEFSRWEHAVALAGVLLGVNPFGQPNVAAAKDATSAVLDGTLSAPEPTDRTDDGAGVTFVGALPAPGHAEHSLASALTHALSALGTRDFLALLAYLPDDDALFAPLREAVPQVSATTCSAVTLELGPRYLHSTGQYHKGGPDEGVFVVLTAESGCDVPVPGREWGLRALFDAQAEGDLATLAAAGRRVLHVGLPDASAETIRTFADALVLAAAEVARTRSLG